MGIFNLSDDEKILAARAGDLLRSALDRGCPSFTDFLSDREKAIVLWEASSFGAGDNVLAFGGYEDAERTVIGFFPEYYFYSEKDELFSEFPITALSIECSGFKVHTHRDFLGSILGLGLERTVIGDIIVGENGYNATVFVHSKAADFILENLRLVGRDGVKVRALTSVTSLEIKRNFEIIKGTCASMRVDAIISEIFNISRDKAQKLVSDGYVTVNHEEILDKSKALSLGDIFTVRGFGKFRVSEIGDVNRRGRTRFEIQKYI